MRQLSPSEKASVVGTAQRLGVNPVDLLTTMNYETGGALQPSTRNPWGYLGLIQFGQPEQQRYGVHAGQTFEEQMGSVENFLRDRGVRPGMDLANIYSTINAGSPGKMGAMDMGTTVAQKVNSRSMSQYRNMAATQLNGASVGSPMVPVAPIPTNNPTGGVLQAPANQDLGATPSSRFAPSSVQPASASPVAPLAGIASSLGSLGGAGGKSASGASQGVGVAVPPVYATPTDPNLFHSAPVDIPMSGTQDLASEGPSWDSSAVKAAYSGMGKAGTTSAFAKLIQNQVGMGKTQAPSPTYNDRTTGSTRNRSYGRT